MVKKALSIHREDDLAALETIVEESFAAARSQEEILTGYRARLSDYFRARRLASEHDPSTKGAIAKIARYLDAHYGEEIAFQDLAARFGVSPAYLSTLFRKYIGVAPTKYLIRLRVEKAKELIAQNADIPFNQVAGLVGYEDPRYFSRIFKATTGVSPSEFRLCGTPE